MSTPIRNRIKGHRRVRAGELVPHEFNFRLHPDGQRAALEALYAEVGFARSLLAYELPDGRLKLIDGHLRRDIDPDMLVDVQVLDVDDAEARMAAAAPAPVEPGPVQYLVLVTCRDERNQVELLQRFTGEGLTCRALLS